VSSCGWLPTVKIVLVIGSLLSRRNPSSEMSPMIIL
jgi:hypothetical protein